jgi:SLA1 homology domain 1, SHD1
VSELFRKHASCLLGLILIIHSQCSSQAQDLLQPAPDMPAYRLGSISQGKDNFGRPSVTLDYTRTKDGVGVAALSGRTTDGPLKIMGFGYLNEASGKIQLSELFGHRALDAELYLVVAGSFAEEVPFKCLVSNVVRTGNPTGAAAAGREWNDAESAAYQKDLIGRKPPLSPPEGYQLVRASTKLIPGMPVKVGRFGKWVDAEALTSQPTVTVKVSGVEGFRMLKRDGWIAIEPAVLQKGASSPGSFQPSSIVIPGTTEILPDGYVVVNESVSLAPGTPVRAIWHNKLSDATVISVDDKQVLTHYDGQSSAFDKKLDPSALVISKETLAELDQPDATQRFKERIPKQQSLDKSMEIRAVIDEQSKKIEAESKRIEEMVEQNLAAANNGTPPVGSFSNNLPALPLLLQNNPIDIPIPKEAELVPLDFPLPRGTKLAACWGRKWNYVTVLKENKEDTVAIHWDDRPPSSDGLIHRTQLIIRRSDLKKLRIKATREEKRTWTDLTGKHRVEARLLSRTSSQVTLIKDDGKEVTLSIDKLSQVDQKWLKENP